MTARTLVLTSCKPLDARDSTPNYPKFGATVAKYRKLPPTAENVKAHAEALFSQLATFRRQEFQRTAYEEPGRACPCASGTWHTEGKKILAAVNSQNRANMDRALADSWKRRTDKQVGIALKAALAGRDAPLVANIHV